MSFFVKSLFSQSCVILTENWRDWLNKNEKSIVSYNPESGTLIIKDKSLLQDAIFELNTFHFHLNLYKAIAKNPLSVLYSLIWTVCISIPVPREHTDSDFYLRWLPFSLFHRFVDRIDQSLRLEKLLGVRSTPLTNLGTTAFSNINEETSDELLNLFDIEQLYEIEKNYEKQFDVYIQNKEDKEKLKKIYNTDRRNYLLSDVFQQQRDNTPYGSIETVQIDDNNITIRYVPSYNDLVDKYALCNNFHRTLIFENLRKQCENSLRRKFRNYHELYGLNLDTYLFATLPEDYNSVRKEDDESEDRKYLMIWQYQKSELIWIILHSLFALVEITKEDNLVNDLLFFITDGLELFVECGMCHNHWLKNGKLEWMTLVSRYELLRNQHLNGSLDNSVNFYRRYEMERQNFPFDILMLHTHNDIQANNVNASKRLSDACLDAISRDYKYVGVALSNAILLELSKYDENDDSTKETSLDLESSREDVLRDIAAIRVNYIFSTEKEELLLLSENKINPAQRCVLMQQMERINKSLKGNFM